MKKAGVTNNSATVPISMPPTAPTPSEVLPLAPTPEANISGSRPNIMVSAVIRIGLKRTPAAEMAACDSDMPSLRRSVAYSVSRIAVFDKSPISMISPVCK